MTLTSGEYVTKQGLRCPNCEQDNLEGTGVEHTEFGTEYYTECQDCGATWIERHDLVGYDHLELKEAEEDE